MKFKNSMILILALGAFAVTSCDDDDDVQIDNEVTITITEPQNGEVIQDASNVHINLEVEATDENHEIEVRLYPLNDLDNLVIDFDLHDHEQSQILTFDVDLSAALPGTQFRLEVEACEDHDCDRIETETITFTVN